MRLSFTSSSDTYRARLRFPARVFGYLLLLIAIGEILLRLPPVTQRLPQPELLLWHAPNVQAKVDYLKQLQAARGVDVLFMGNSTVLAGMDPRVFDLSRNRSADGGPAAFNGSLEGLSVYGTLTFVKEYLRYSHPTTIVYGITPQDLNANSPATKDITDKVKASEMVIADRGAGLDSWLLSTLLSYSRLYRYRLLLHQMLIQGGNYPLPKIYFDDRGFVPSNERLSDIPEAGRKVYYNNVGVVNYAVKGQELDALKELLSLAQKNGIRLVLVNMPLTTDYFGNFKSLADYQTYLTTVSQLAAAYQVPFWDMQSLPSNNGWADADFADLNHLNRYGAEKLSALLGQRYADPSGVWAKAGGS